MTNKINMVINLSILALLIYLSVAVKQLQDKVFPDPNIMIPLIELEKRFENVHLFDPFVYLCDEKICSTHDDKGIRQFRDDDHISSYGASKLAPGLREIFEKIDNNKKIIE